MRPWIPVTAALVLAGAAAFVYKVVVLHYPLSTAELPGTWRVELVLNVTGRGGRAVLETPLPRTSDYQRLLTEEVRSGLLRFSIESDGSGRRGRWTGRLKRSTTVSYEVTVDALVFREPAEVRAPTRPLPESVSAYLNESPGIQSADPAVAELSQELSLAGKNQVELAAEIYRFVSREIGSLRTAASMDAVAVLREGRGNDLGRARLFCALARFNELPCRVIAGIPLVAGRQDRFHYWNEAHVGQRWVPYDTVVRRKESLPPDRLALGPVTDRESITSAGTSSLSYHFYVQPELETYAELVRSQVTTSPHFLDRISLLFLPVQLQHTLRILLLVPLGALTMCVLRNIVGFRTFGMFMPMLIALAMTGTGLVWGTAFLALIISAALITRLWIRRLYLLLAARIAFILTLVILFMIALFLVGHRLHLPSSGVGAFPFVIMTMIVERISVSLEEEGAANTVRRIASTLAAIYLTYAVIHARELQTVFLVFPEFLLVILGLLVAVGSYSGYRLTEFFRFRELSTAQGRGPKS